MKPKRKKDSIEAATEFFINKKRLEQNILNNIASKKNKKDVK